MKDPRRMSIDLQAVQRPALSCFREHAVVLGHALGKTDGLFLLINEFVGAGGGDLHDDESDGIGTEIDDGNTFHGQSLFCKQWSGAP